MKTIYLNDTVLEALPCVATIGMFDGVHRGHQFVISHLLQEAERRGLPSCVITFDRHPRATLQCSACTMHSQLTTLEEKLMLLSLTGIDLCVVITFDSKLASMSAYDFMLHVLKERLGVRLLLMGYDNHFGHRAGQQESFSDYQSYGKQMGLEVKSLPCCAGKEGMAVSSSLVRRLLAEGHIEEANKALGYCYPLTGVVVSGEHVGTNLGFPTANLQLDGDKLIPAGGVYAVRVRLANSLEQKHGMTNIGTRPTFTNDAHPATSIETYILRHEGKLYGQRITVNFVHRLREERRFDSPEALVSQLSQDAERVEELLTQDIEE